MELRPLGRTDLKISALGFGCGNIGGLMVRGDPADQRQVIARAVDVGLTYFDTAPAYGNGLSEINLGQALSALNLTGRVRVGTKVRLTPADLADPVAAIRSSLEASLRRMGRDSVDVLHLHNHIGGTVDQAESGRALSFGLVVGAVAEGLAAVRRAGLAHHVGFTGLGEAPVVRALALREPFESGQCYFNPINPSAGYFGARGGQQDFEGLIDTAGRAGLGVMAIRVFAAATLADADRRPPIAGSPGGPLIEGEDPGRDMRRAAALTKLAEESGLESVFELALRFVLSKPGVSTALVGFSNLEQLNQAIRWTERGPLVDDVVRQIVRSALSGG